MEQDGTKSDFILALEKLRKTDLSIPNAMKLYKFMTSLVEMEKAFKWLKNWLLMRFEKADHTVDFSDPKLQSEYKELMWLMTEIEVDPIDLTSEDIKLSVQDLVILTPLLVINLTPEKTPNQLDEKTDTKKAPTE